MRKKEKVINTVLLISVIITTLVFGGLSAGCTSAQGTQTGNLAPDFQLTSLDGQPVSLNDFRGNSVLLNFWASWCGPCKSEMPYLQMMHEEWSSEGWVILAVDIGESPVTVSEFVAKYALSFMVLLDTDQQVALKYNVRSIPTTFFIDENGKIRDIKIGAFSSKAEIERRLEKINQ
ncbi:redoxin domain-containing protein [Chloroflexota bacterium]